MKRTNYCRIMHFIMKITNLIVSKSIEYFIEIAEHFFDDYFKCSVKLMLKI